MLRQIKYFQVVVRLGSFTEAAEECFISQSAISQQIQALEKKLGFQLLKRGNRSFTVTPAGEYFYQKSLVLTSDYEKLCRDATKIARQDKLVLRLGYLNAYGGYEFKLALAEFSHNHPDVDITVTTGNHEELSQKLFTDQVDLILSDQRRAFSDEYHNLLLTKTLCFIELVARSPLAAADSIEISDLKNTPCVLIASPGQEEIERQFYRDVIGFTGEFLFAGDLEKARLMLLSGKGVMPIDSDSNATEGGMTLRRVPLTRGGKRIERNYCAFWKVSNSESNVEEYATILKAQFIKK